MKVVLLFALFVGAMAVALAQDAVPAKTTPALSELEAARVEISLQNETIVRLKIQLAELQRQYDVLQLTLDRQQRTPAPKDGHVWDWTIDQQTGRPKGYVPKLAEPNGDGSKETKQIKESK